MAERNARQEAPTPQRSQPPVFHWPTDETGRPLALVTMGCSELIGLPSFSNILICPAQAPVFVGPDSPVSDEMYQAIKDGLRRCVLATEEVLGEERQVLLDLVNGKAPAVVVSGPKAANGDESEAAKA